MLMRAATSDGEVPPEKTMPGCWEGDGVGRAITVVVVVGITAGSVSVRPRSRYRLGNGLEVVKEGDDMAG